MVGVTFPWSSADVVAPLGLSGVGWAAFHLYENGIAEPTVARRLFQNRNAAIRFLLTFQTGVFLASPTYFLPLCFQSLKGASPLALGVDTLLLNTAMLPTAVLSGAVMAKKGVWRPNHATWQRRGCGDRYMQWLGPSLPSDLVYFLPSTLFLA